ncbi:MAG TPA: histidinol-phosphatase [Gemmatimonadota bacterium]|nr:histidinol-phosphatase [Gemmatimonadota bacterium]
MNPPNPAPRWWKGNLHTHSLWSDGDELPELAIHWYKSNGYHFVAMTDHNVMPDEIRWVDLAWVEGRGTSLERLRGVMGDDWAETRQVGDTLQVRLRTPSEIAPRLEEPNRFLLVHGEEISDSFEDKQIHVNGANLVETIPPQGGASVAEVIAKDVIAVREQGRATGRLVFAQVNHPNFTWAVEAGHLAGMPAVDPGGPAFFEVYNGHFLVANAGDSLHPSTDRMWDLALTDRLRRGEGILYGVGTDDTHDYHGSGPGGARPGRGWVVVRADTLSTEALIRAMLAGEFYASSGIELDSIQRTGDRIAVAIRPEKGVTYRTQFIGTRKDASGPEEAGIVLAEVDGPRAEYLVLGDELYVRAKVLSSKVKENAPVEGVEELEAAWVQPVVPAAGE